MPSTILTISLSSNLHSGSKAKFILVPDDPASTYKNTTPNNKWFIHIKLNTKLEILYIKINGE